MTANIDRKTLDKIRKLLNLAKDGAATEGEASVAMEKAREIMAANNLTMAQLEAAGQAGGEGSSRLKGGMKGKALYKYQQALMATVCDTNFCAALLDTKWNGRRAIDTGYTIIGREANVVAAINMFEYLNASLERIVTSHLESNSQRLSRWAVSFKEGAAQRLAERLRERHQEELARQSAAARAQREAAPTAGALVVVMEDFAQAEADANYEHRMGWEPGEAARRRAERDKRLAEHARREEERRANLTEEERAAEDAEREKNRAKWEAKWDRANDRYWANKDVGAYFQGREEADQIGLDAQVSRSRQAALK